jgi:hypothetical protein
LFLLEKQFTFTQQKRLDAHAVGDAVVQSARIINEGTYHPCRGRSVYNEYNILAGSGPAVPEMFQCRYSITVSAPGRKNNKKNTDKKNNYGLDKQPYGS